MCYRAEQSLDFSGMHLVCLAGDNGHGKSTLLDAMTWALWGKARARRDDELITLGETEMWVEFEFGLGPLRYRIWRQRSKKGRGQSDLHFYVWNEAGGDWQPLDEGNLNERQALITRTLRMDYDTFVNSAFLLQGRADSFTVKTPAERKQILADILGLARYDAYEQRAKDEAQARREQAERIQGEIAAADRELARREEHEARLAAARAHVEAAALACRAAEADQARARQAVGVLEEQERQLADLRARGARAERDLSDTRQALASAQGRLAEFEAVLAQRAAIEAGWAALQDARRRDEAWRARLIEHSQLRDRLGRVQLAVGQARAALEAEQGQLAKRGAELGRRMAAAVEQKAVLAEAQEVLARFAALAARREALAAELQEAAGRMGTLKAENERAKAEGQALRDRLEMLGQGDGAACPLCGQPLDAAHREEMVGKLSGEREQLLESYRAHQAEMKALADGQKAREAEDAGLARELRARDARQGQAARAEAAVADGEAAAAELAGLQAQQAGLARSLSAGDYALAERAEQAKLESEIGRVAYDAAAHQGVQAELERWGPFDALYQRQLVAALAGIDEANERVAALAAQAGRREEELAEDRERAGRLEAALRELPELRAALARAEAALSDARDAERRARQEEGAAMQQLAVLATLEERRARLAAELSAANEEISLFQQLREAFGKRGLQAMIIESAIPEVEAEANRLLGRMSEGRMSLRLETQREKVTGGMAETLDIIISDELGARDYNLYSGGESFRANLALRIAISKLLARRAGAQLQTLVIDEGFGTQDAQGRQLLVDAISSIQHDFARVLVITHIDELKDLFPARIDVTKTAAGSRVTIA